MAGKGILLNENNEPVIINGSMLVGDSELQEVAIILGMNQGDQKFNPMLGPNLMQLIKTSAPRFDIEQRTRVHLAKDGKDYQSIKDKLKITKNV